MPTSKPTAGQASNVSATCAASREPCMITAGVGVGVGGGRLASVAGACTKHMRLNKARLVRQRARPQDRFMPFSLSSVPAHLRGSSALRQNDERLMLFHTLARRHFD